MASKRMFAVSVIEGDTFLDLPIDARLAYFYFLAHTDDEGFVGNPKTVCRIAGVDHDGVVSQLESAGFVMSFDSGVIYVIDFGEQNKLVSKRIKPTKYQDEKAAVCSLLGNCFADDKQSSDSCTTDDKQSSDSCQPSLGEPSLEELNAEEPSAWKACLALSNKARLGRLGESKANEFSAPSFSEVSSYAASALGISNEEAVNFYDSMRVTGWECGDSWKEELQRWADYPL